ncbi:hypothetical protein Srufu_013290 [Streptomyces libani subsp. rufus]|nr:hypothetical protein Srufu_013290 [Streptomyces libani subsp. rufus]
MSINRRTRASKWWACAAVVVISALAGCGGNDGHKTHAKATSSARGRTAAHGGGGGGQNARPADCRTDDSDQEKPTASPKDLYWKPDGTSLVPMSKSAGPLKFDGPVWYCFAHTPMGAVLAVHAITDHFGYPRWREVVERQLVPGPGRDAFIAERSRQTEKPGSGQLEGGGYAGFSVLAYNKKEATVMVLVRMPNAEQYGSLSATVRWQDGDWKVLPDSHGAVYSGGSHVDGTNGFVTWES